MNAGWYRDRNDPSIARYWDGEKWTENTRPVDTPPSEPKAGEAAEPLTAVGMPSQSGPASVDIRQKGSLAASMWGSVVFAFMAVLATILVVLQGGDRMVEPALRVWGFVLLPALIVAFMTSFALHRASMFVVSSTNVSWKFGARGQRQESVPVNAISSVELRQSFMGKRFGYGTVILQTVFGSPYELRNVSEPQLFADAVSRVCRTVSAEERARVAREWALAQGAAQPHYSADGRFYWDGFRWAPAPGVLARPIDGLGVTSVFLAPVALIFAFFPLPIGFAFGVFALIFGLMGIARVNAGKRTGGGIAVTGAALGFTAMVLNVALFMFWGIVVEEISQYGNGYLSP